MRMVGDMLIFVKKAVKRYKLWLRAELARKKVTRLMADGADCFSTEMLTALKEFHTADEECKRYR